MIGKIGKTRGAKYLIKMIKRSCRYRVVVFAKCKWKRQSRRWEQNSYSVFFPLCHVLPMDFNLLWNHFIDSHSCNCFWIWILVFPLYQLLLFFLALYRISSSSSSSLFVFSKCIALFVHCLAFLCPSTLSFLCGGKNGTRCLVTFPVLRPWKNFP